MRWRCERQEQVRWGCAKACKCETRICGQGRQGRGVQAKARSRIVRNGKGRDGKGKAGKKDGAVAWEEVRLVAEYKKVGRERRHPTLKKMS